MNELNELLSLMSAQSKLDNLGRRVMDYEHAWRNLSQKVEAFLKAARDPATQLEVFDAFIKSTGK